MFKPKLLAALVAVATAAALVIGPAAFVTARTTTATDTNFTNIPIHGHVPDGSGKRFAGTMDIKRFVKDNGKLKAVARITGVMKNSNGKVIGHVSDAKRTLKVAEIGTGDGSTTLSAASASAATCKVLHLVLGPLDLNLLGLTVHLNKVVLNIDAHSGPGNLLGNLICAIAHLLDPPTLSGQQLAAIKDILNTVVGILKL